MRRPANIIFAIWCVLVVIIFAIATRNAWSPDADGPRGGGSGGIYAGGPRHK